MSVGFAIGAMMVGATVTLAFLLGEGSFGGTVQSLDFGLFDGLSPAVGTLASVLFVVLFVLLYELLFRGFVLVNVAEGLSGATTDRTAILGGILVSALFFAVVHAPLSDVAPVTFLSLLLLFALVLSGVVAITGRLAAAIGIHTGWAVLAGPVFGTPFRGIEASSGLLVFDIEGSPAVTGGAFGLDGGLIAVCGVGIGVLGIACWVRFSSLDWTVASSLTTPDLLERNLHP